MPLPIAGVHHITSIAGDPQQNLDFYSRLLGLRLVKRTVNFDDPGTYHLYYGDERGRPGTVLTFFPWSNAPRGKVGSGEARDVSFAVPPDAVPFWIERFGAAGIPHEGPRSSFDRPEVRVKDPDGATLRLVEAADATNGEGESSNEIPAARGIRGFEGVTLAVNDPDRTATFLRDVFGCREAGENEGLLRFEMQTDGVGRALTVARANAPARSGAGSVHHVAFRARDEDEQREWQEELRSRGMFVTEVKDRNYFRSIYFREPGGILFEIATDGPGFEVDEDVQSLGSHLKLPEWLEAHRPRIEQQLPPLRFD